MFISQEDLIKLLVALVLGGIIGLEREIHAKAAGLRTITLICVGATIFTLVSTRFADPGSSRVASNIVSGVGLLCAGAIIFAEGRLKGLTTASSIWVAASLGIAIGIGEFGLAGVATALVVLVLWLFAHVDRWLDVLGREVRTYSVSYLPNNGKYAAIEKSLAGHGLSIVTKKRLKIGTDLMQGEWEVKGPLAKHNKFVDDVLADKDVVEVKY